METVNRAKNIFGLKNPDISAIILNMEMDVKTEKLWMIEQLLKIKDEVLLHQLKNLFETIYRKQEEERFKPMPLDAFYAKIEESEKALERGEIINQDDLREEIKTWKKQPGYSV